MLSEDIGQGDERQPFRPVKMIHPFGPVDFRQSVTPACNDADTGAEVHPQGNQDIRGRLGRLFQQSDQGIQGRGYE
jgi:hypothetical protein